MHSFREVLRLVSRKKILYLSSVLCFAFATAVLLGTGDIAYKVFFAPLTGVDTHGLVKLTRVSVEGEFRSFSFPEFDSLRASRSVALGLFTDPVPVLAEGEGDHAYSRMSIEYTSEDLLSMLGGRVMIGKGDLGRASDKHTAVISYKFWRSRFHSSPDVVGRGIAIAGKVYSIVGVADPSYVGPVKGLEADAWLDLYAMDRACIENSACRTFRMMGRLRNPASIAQAGTELSALLQRVNASDHALVRVSGARAGFLPVDLATQSRLAFLFYLAAIVFVLSVLNITILLLSASAARVREIAVRVAVGAQGKALVKLFLLESAFIVGSGVVLGVALSKAISVAMDSFLTGALPLTLTGANLLLPIAALALLFIGAAPYAALAIFEVRRTEVSEALKTSSRLAAQTPAQKRFARRLISVQLVLTVVLLSSAVTFGVRLTQLARVRTGFDTDRLEFVSTAIPPKEQARAPQLLTALTDKFASLPGVKRCAVIAPSLLQGEAWMARATDPVAAGALDSLLIIASPAVFDTLGVPLVAGSGFDLEGTRGDIAVVSTKFAHRLWGGEPCIGRSIYTPETGRLTVVGEVPDLLLTDIRDTVSPVLFVPMSNEAARHASFSLVLRTAPALFVSASNLSAATHQTAPGLIIDGVETGPERIGAAVSQIRVITDLAVIFAVLAAAVVVIGVYASLRTALRQRTLEIGIRLALGDNPRALRKRLLWENCRVLLVAVAVGVGIAIFSGAGIGSALYGIGIESRLSALAPGSSPL